MTATLAKLRQECTVAFVGGSDLVKITEQLSVGGVDGQFNQSDQDSGWSARPRAKEGAAGRAAESEGEGSVR